MGTLDADEDASWKRDVPTDGTVRLAPDARVVDAIGGNHLLETAVADLVDNSIDGGAGQVLVRFAVANSRIESFYVIDDGQGISDLDNAMTAGGSRKYGANDLGHFGVGLKAASFSQADSLTVVTKTAEGQPEGRRWLKAKARQTHECDVVNAAFCRNEFARARAAIGLKKGTIVRWDDIQSFPEGREADVTDRYIQDATGRIKSHLGLVFHRFLSAGRISIGIEVEDASQESRGLALPVRPVDPFRYLRSGATGYPRTLSAEINGVQLDLVCHVWSGRSDSEEFKLGRKDAYAHQGIYFYRRDRLLQAGGWNNVEVRARDLQLARVSIDIPQSAMQAAIFRMNAEKSHIDCSADFSRVVADARGPDGTSFSAYLDTARAAYKTSRSPNRSRPRITPIGRGLPPTIKQTLEEEIGFLPGYEKVEIRWRRFADETFFDVDRDAGVLWLNQRYRGAVSPQSRGTFNDAPLVKTLLFLLVENLFHGERRGWRDKDNLDMWQTVLTDAARQQLQ
jgi:hypothetical protein